jgi:hypothetical protein
MRRLSVGFSGSRTIKRDNFQYWDDLICAEILQIVSSYNPATTLFASGGAESGADFQLKCVCHLLEYEYTDTPYKPDFSSGYAKWKFFERNERLAKDVNKAYCIWDGQSKGTKHFISCMLKEIAKGQPKQLHIIPFSLLETQAIRKITISEKPMKESSSQAYIYRVYYYHPADIELSPEEYFAENLFILRERLYALSRVKWCE